MAQKLRNKNQRTNTSAAGLDKRDPLDLETLNSEPNENGKSKKSRIQERREQEKLLQQHRLQQQESLKRQRERGNAQKAHPTTETNQHTQHEQQASSIAKTPPDVRGENQHPGTEAHDPEIQSAVPDHETSNRNDEGHGALGDSISQNVKPNHRRCTNCCGRSQIPDRQRAKHYDKCSEKPERTEDIQNRNGVDQCSLEHVNDEIKDQGKGHEGCGCLNNGKTPSCHSSQADEGVHSEVWTSDTERVNGMGNFEDKSEFRLRGGCGGGCGGSGGRSSACCPCGTCGGATCSTNTSYENRPPAGCCGGNQSRGLPCRCRCKSCSSPIPPCGTCGGQNCGKWNSCAGSGGGKCCFPRNTRRHNGADCCGGGSGGCGGCC